MVERKERDSKQLNLRMPIELLEDIDKLATILRVNKSEWIKIKLSELVHQEKSKIIDHYMELEQKGLMHKKDIEKFMK